MTREKETSSFSERFFFLLAVMIAGLWGLAE